MGPKAKTPQTGNLFQQPLTEQIDMQHPLVKLTQLIDWEVFEKAWSGFFPSKTGRPASPPRLIAGLLYLQHTYAYSDEALLMTWIENPYWQHFCGISHFQHRAPIDASSLTRWRKRIGEAGVEELLAASIQAAKRAQVIEQKSLERVIVDTTVLEKAVAYPTESKLLERARQHLVKFAEKHQLKLRQNYNRQAPQLARQTSQYAHAKQYKRMRKVLSKQRTLVGRVWRDVARQLPELIAGWHNRSQQRIMSLMGRIQQLLQQRPDTPGKDKVYSIHAPEVECIGKGKARTPWEFGVKVSIATTHKEGLVVGMRSMPGNPSDGHTLAETLEQVSILTDCLPKEAFVDRGYRGAQQWLKHTKVWISGQRRGVTLRIKKALRRRSSIEASIGHMKNEGRLRRNWLKGALGDALHAVLCGAGHNLRLILKALRLCFAYCLSSLMLCIAILHSFWRVRRHPLLLLHRYSTA